MFLKRPTLKWRKSKILRSLPKKCENKMNVIQEVKDLTFFAKIRWPSSKKLKDLTTLPLEELIGLLMTHEIPMNKYQRVKEKKKYDIALKALTIDDEEEESEDENFDIISKKFMKYIKLEKIKGGFYRKKDKMIFSKDNEVLKKKKN